MPSHTRTSAYRRSYGAERKTTSVALTPEMRKTKEAEKEKLKKCNNRLVNYIDKVHDLVEANKALKTENALLRKAAGHDQQKDVAGLYEDELSRLRSKVEELSVENQKLEIEKENLKYDLDELEEKYDEVSKEKEDIEKEVKNLRKDVDDATIERVSMESKLENLQETLQLERQAHAVELDNLRSQIQPVHAVVVENEPSSLTPDLTDAIQQVRQQYEAFNTKNMESLDSYYKEKVEGLHKQNKSLQEDNNILRIENNDQRKQIHQLELELESLRSKTDNLERQIDDLEDRLAKQNNTSQEKIHALGKELDDAKQDLGKYLKEYQDLNNLKLSLDQEIAIYHKLLQGEESKNIDVEVAEGKPVRARSASPAARKSRSHSRSSASSRSSSASSKSSEGSPTRTTSDVVGEMLEEKAPKEEKGVVSVTWKVKGGTVRPSEPFNPADDAEKLHEAIKGRGTDEDTIINILAGRNKAQRLAIANVYEDKYDTELIEDLKQDLSGDLKTVTLHLMWSRSVMDANALRKAVKGFGTDEAVLIEILCTQTSREIQEIKASYASEFPDRSLEEDIEKETSGSFKQFLLAVLKANRPVDSGTVLANQADEDAQELHKMAVKDWTPAHPKFLEIFTQRSFEHLWFLFNQSWPKLSEDNLLETIDKECKGDLKKGLKALIRFSVFIPPLYYATQLHEAMKGFGTEDEQLIYIVTTRSEIDMIDIKEEFGNKYGEPLAKKIKSETKGDYRKMLLKLIDEDD
ncbi:uncharacterized protein LOC120330013 [Styela clava]